MEGVRDEPMLSVRDTARAMRVSINTVRKWIREEKLRAVKMGWSYRIERDELERIKKEGVNA